MIGRSLLRACSASALTVVLGLVGALPASAGPDLGFTRWPADLTVAGQRTADRFLKNHGNLVALHLERGVPWPESLAGTPYPADVRSFLSYRPPAGHRLFVSISPLNAARDGMALRWGSSDEQPLPPGWTGLRFDDPRVVRAYGAYAERVVRSLHPDYLAIGVEVNILLTHDPAAWQAYLRLNRQVRARLRARFPGLPVFATVDVLHLRGYDTAADPVTQEREVHRLMADSDLFAMSVYPFMSAAAPAPVPARFFDFATRYGRPVAVSETGYTSRDVRVGAVTLRGSPALQAAYYRTLLAVARRDRYRFVCTFATTDYDALVRRLPPEVRELAGIWQYTGLQTGAGVAKPALRVWDHAGGRHPRVVPPAGRSARQVV